jgi:hypothetical protein
MGIMLTGFLGGVAKGVTESIDEEEKRAATAAQLQAKVMFENYNKVKEQNAELSSKLKSGIDYLKSNGIQGTEEEYFKAAKNPQVIALLQEKVKAGGFDPTGVNLAEIVGATQSLDGKTAKQFIDKSYDLNQQKYVKPEASDKPVNFIQGFGNKAAEDTFNRTATMLGVSPDTLRATVQYKRPELDIDNTYNLSSLYGNKAFDKLEDESKANLNKALASGDANKIATATEAVSRFAIVKGLADKTSKTEDQIQTELRNKIFATDNPKEKNVLTAELRQRQVLSKLPGEGQEKISQSNLITVASKAITSAISDKLTPGTDFIIVQNPDGTTTQQIKTLKAANIFNEATELGRKAVVKEMTGPDGKPKDQLHRNALISIGVNFDNEGRAVVPKALQVDDQGNPKPTPVKVEEKPATPAPAKPATTTQPTTAKPLPYLADGTADKGKLVKGQAYEDNGVVKIWNGIGWVNK